MKKHGEVKQTEVVLCQAKLKIGRIYCIDGLQFCYTDPFGGLVTAKLLPLKLLQLVEQDRTYKMAISISTVKCWEGSNIKAAEEWFDRQ